MDVHFQLIIIIFFPPKTRSKLRWMQSILLSSYSIWSFKQVLFEFKITLFRDNKPLLRISPLASQVNTIIMSLISLYNQIYLALLKQRKQEMECSYGSFIYWYIIQENTSLFILRGIKWKIIEILWCYSIMKYISKCIRWSIIIILFQFKELSRTRTRYPYIYT